MLKKGVKKRCVKTNVIKKGDKKYLIYAIAGGKYYDIYFVPDVDWNPKVKDWNPEE